MENILIIDDEKSLLDLLSVVLKKEGYRVKTCLAASQGLRASWRRKNSTCSSATSSCPRSAGWRSCKYVRENRPEIPVIMITAYGSLKQAVEALKAGAIDYILKPFDVEELKIIVAQGAREEAAQGGEHPPQAEPAARSTASRT